MSWSASKKIGRILHNATYKGYNCYLKSFSNNYLEQKRIKNLDEETYMYVKGDFEPIVSEEIWDKCSEIRKARTTKMIVNKGERTYGKKSTQDVWLRKLRCSCGSTFRKTSGEPIREAMRFLGISVIIRSTMAARLSEKRMVLIQRGTAIFAWLATGS